jgi:hypothetical protein
LFKSFQTFNRFAPFQSFGEVDDAVKFFPASQVLQRTDFVRRSADGAALNCLSWLKTIKRHEAGARSGSEELHYRLLFVFDLEHDVQIEIVDRVIEPQKLPDID